MADFQNDRSLLDALIECIEKDIDSSELVQNYHDLRRGYRFTPDGPEIPLTRGYWSKISPEDLEAVVQHKWFAVGDDTRAHPVTARAKIDGRAVQLGRFVLGLGAGDPLIADHVNYDTLDNRRCNLRAVTKTESAQHRRAWSRKLKAGPTSKHKGVYWRPDNGLWRAVIKFQGQPISLGQFADEDDAARAYDSAARRYHGQFAELNYG
ncbi:AP2 domain-containing protein [Sphingopyxis flava]|uniref:AP2 domain-containing protein n=1 Tax=Sphingopyxis flava TaxID=1507287 RepID=A0A1T5CVJ1_9SPHN|nr:AP2 domain-containing protein [Sphingopyxis flava]SKB63356.1 AP2 domain-containing protein [Sphingopyxis flava]